MEVTNEIKFAVRMLMLKFNFNAVEMQRVLAALDKENKCVKK
jgi:hypothetical protein